MKKKSISKNINSKSLLIGLISLVIIVYSLILIVNTVNNGIKRYSLIETEQMKLDKLKVENQNLQKQLAEVNNIDDKTRQALNNFNLVDPEARVYIVTIPEEVKYLDVKAEIQNYVPKNDERSNLQKFFDDLLGK